MKKSIKLFLSVLFLIHSIPSFANMDIAKKNNCMVCHSLDKKVVGPSFNDIKIKYKGDLKNLDELMIKVKKGGSGKWGSIPMPANPQISDGDLKTLLTFILKN